VFESGVLREVCGAKGDGVTGSGENYRVRSLMIALLTNIIWVIKSRRMRWAGHVAGMEKRIGEYRVYEGRPEGKRQHGKPRSRWEGNFKIYFEGLRMEKWT
jgi:hypothetical protein